MCSLNPNPFPVHTQSQTEWKIDQTLSVYIPHVANENATEEYIRNVFYRLNIAVVKRVDFQPKHSSVYSDDPSGKSAFVHMERWFENVSVEHLQGRIIDNIDNIESNESNKSKEARIVHDDPNYWVLKRNKNPIPDNYAENFTKLTDRINYLEKTNIELEATLGHVWWWIRHHDTNIGYLFDKFKNINIVQATPIKPSTSNSTNIMTSENGGWSKRLRKRSYSK